MAVLVVGEQQSPVVNQYTYWERFGLFKPFDVSLESSMLEWRTLMLM